jgi:Tol biopolymer transport system component
LARWGPVDGFRVAYLAGTEVRVVNGDGTGDRRLGQARAGVAPAWMPDDQHVLAYADPAGRVQVVAVDSGARVWRSPPLAHVRQLLWSSDGRRLLALTPRRLVVWDSSGFLVAASTAPAGSIMGGAVWAPRAERFAVVRWFAGRSQIVLLDADRKLFELPLFSVRGRLGAPAWSPDGSRILAPWPDANQWLFLRADGHAPAAAVANIARQFTPGATSPAFPDSVAWCC